MSDRPNPSRIQKRRQAQQSLGKRSLATRLRAAVVTVAQLVSDGKMELPAFVKSMWHHSRQQEPRRLVRRTDAGWQARLARAEAKRERRADKRMRDHSARESGYYRSAYNIEARAYAAQARAKVAFQ